MASDRAIFTLPLPPSLNQMYRVGVDSKPHLIKEAREYRKMVAEVLFEKEVKCPEPPFDVGIHFRFPSMRRRDISNQVKLLEDSIFKHFNHDDTHVHALHLWKYLDRREPGVTVEIRHSTRNIDITQ